MVTRALEFEQVSYRGPQCSLVIKALLLLYKDCIVFFLVFDEMMHYSLGQKEYRHNLDGI